MIGSLIVLVGLAILFLLTVNPMTIRGDPPDIRAMARQASVQTVFHVPVLHAYFTTPLPEPDILTAEKVKEMLEQEQAVIEKKIDAAIEKCKEEQKADHYSTSLTNLEKWGYEPKSKTLSL